MNLKQTVVSYAEELRKKEPSNEKLDSMREQLTLKYKKQIDMLIEKGRQVQTDGCKKYGNVYVTLYVRITIIKEYQDLSYSVLGEAIFKTDYNFDWYLDESSGLLSTIILRAHVWDYICDAIPVYETADTRVSLSMGVDTKIEFQMGV